MGTIIKSSGIVSNLIERKIGNIVAGDYAPAFPLKHLHKDLGLMTDTARQVGVQLPATDAYFDLFTRAKAAGLGEQDAVALYRQLASMAGIG